MTRAIDDLAAIEGVAREQAEVLVNSGFLTVEGILTVDIEDLQETAGFDADTAKAIYEAAAAAQTDDEG